jgi:HlyD family secretion protein
MNSTKLREIRIEQAERQRPQRAFWGILVAVLGVTLVALIFAWPKKSDTVRIVSKATPAAKAQLAQTAPLPTPTPMSNETPGAVLTVSGYIINHERIELSPRFPGVVNWIGVKKGDRVTKSEVVVLLDDAEQRARLLESEGHLASANARLEKAQLAFDRAKRLRENRVESQQLEDDARVEVAAARAAIKEAEGALAYAQTQLEWTHIRSPIDGVVLEKLTEPGELVMPQSFGGTRGPSTAVLAVADPADLQVEIDVNESDLSKITSGQRCRVSPEAYPDKTYGGYVAEIAPEANRQKGTLQVKVQIENPDRYLTPELSARVDFLR